MTKGKIIFTGSFGDYFIGTLGLLVLSFITLGIMFPYFLYWQYKYFVAHLEIEFYTDKVGLATTKQSNL